eukprot:2547850-Pleurochrysis_carterae.AAC.1
MPSQSACRQLDWQLFTANASIPMRPYTDGSSHAYMQASAAVRTREIDACESLVERQTLSQRLAALVADAATPCMQTARMAIVRTALV